MSKELERKRSPWIAWCSGIVLLLGLYVASFSLYMAVDSSLPIPAQNLLRRAYEPLGMFCLRGPDVVADPYIAYIRWCNPRNGQIIGVRRKFDKQQRDPQRRKPGKIKLHECVWITD